MSLSAGGTAGFGNPVRVSVESCAWEQRLTQPKGKRVKPHLLIVDDDSVYAGDLAMVLAADFHCVLAHSPAEAEEEITTDRPAAVLLDFDLGPEHEDFVLLEWIRMKEPSLPVVMMSEQPSIPTVVEAVRRGVFGFLEKSANLDELKLILRNAADWKNKTSISDNKNKR